jgi:hypothetical protein
MVAIEATLSGSEGGIRRADVRTGSIDNDRWSARPQLSSIPRGWMSEKRKTLAARLGKIFSLDIPFHRTL